MTSGCFSGFAKVQALALVAGVASLLAFGTEQAALAKERMRTLVLSAVGEVAAMPDMAIVSFGVETRAKTARQALSDNTARMRKVFVTLKEKWQIAEKDMITSNFSVSPVYRDVKDKQGNYRRLLEGYRVRNMLQVRVRNLESLGGVLDSVVSAGVNRIESVRFDFSDPWKLQQQARRQAVRNVLAKARVIAEEGGFKLGPVIDVRENGGIVPQPRMFRPMVKAMVARSAPVPVAHGEKKLSVRVTFTWEIR